mmetsp:Transcript_30921/g.56036  ORF Transcript_30921/g.56036 Transcript_30921/m.56036 type:complete len:98 (+) Transcript_30921:397-690(+)
MEPGKEHEEQEKLESKAKGREVGYTGKEKEEGGPLQGGCFIEKVLLFLGKSLSTCRIKLYVGKERIALVCGYGMNAQNLEPCRLRPAIASTGGPYGT